MTTKEKDPNRFYVYTITRIPHNGESPYVIYVGKGQTNRYNTHIPALEKGKHFNKHLQAIYNKKDSYFNVEITHSGLTHEDAEIIEIAEIRKYGRDDLNEGPLVNKNDGGKGVRYSDEFAKAISARMQGNTHGIGRKWSEETRLKVKNIWEAKIAAGYVCPVTPIFTEESRYKIRVASLAREQRKKEEGWNFTDEAR